MESYSSSSNTDSSSSASYSYPRRQETKPPPSFRSALHAVRRSPAKNAITKKPIAPLPPTPPKIYKVEPVEFKDIVQKLTGAAEPQPTRLQEVAPPPLSLSPPHNVKAADEEGKMQRSFDTSFGLLSPLGFSLSPSSLAWCSAMLLSPGTLSSFEPSAVL